MCERFIEKDLWALRLIPGHFKTQEMCIKAVEVDSWQLDDVSDNFKKQEMCERAVKKYPSILTFVPDHLKFQETYERAVKKYLRALEFVPDWFVAQEQVKLRHDYDDYHNDNYLIKWYEGYQKRKAQKAQIKKELMSIAWHPSRWWDWCVPEDEKKDKEKLWA